MIQFMFWQLWYSVLGHQCPCLNGWWKNSCDQSWVVCGRVDYEVHK